MEQAIAEAIALVQQSTGSLVKKSPGQDPDHGLSPREREVLRLLIEGRSDRAIGDALFISRRTASKHVGSIIAKLGVASRTEAVAHAMRDRLA